MRYFYRLAAARLAAALGEDEQAIAALLVRPPKPEWGDIGFPCQTLAKSRRTSPAALAAAAAEKLPPEEPFAAVRAMGPYINFTVSAEALAQETLARALAAPQEWGRNQSGQGKTVVIDYSSPNIAKPLGVHHIRSTIIGAALCRLYANAGWRVIAVNHLGDWGTNFGQLMVAYKKAEAENPGLKVDVEALLRLYIQYHAAAEEDERLADEARAWFKRLEDGDAEALRLWRLFVDESLKDLRRLYDRLGVHFDAYLGESFYNDKIEPLLRLLRAKGLLKASEGAEVVALEEYGMPACLIRKRDGATTYAARDLAAAIFRQENYRFDRCLYVVANQQDLHFRQVFKTLELAGCAWASACAHVKFGMLSFGPGVFGEEATTGSTRKGRVIFLEEVLDRAAAKARQIILDNARDEEVRQQADRLAEQVGTGAVIFSEFLQRRAKDVIFTWEKALNLQGDSGPYLQYTHARLCSLRRKYEESGGSVAWRAGAPLLLRSPVERETMLRLAEFAEALSRAVAEDEPRIVADYL
ncbi:MAG: arginine--tRNA ligase, partial [Planctomycetota bacterium]|nr:arginine--tRNA ligase [Planctomycetota bacterium]